MRGFFSKKNNKSDLSPQSRSDPYVFIKKVEKYTPPLFESTTLVIQSFLFF